MQQSHNGPWETSPAGPRIEVKAGLDQVPWDSPIMRVPADWLHFRKLLSPLLVSGSAALPAKKKAPQEQKCINARFIATAAIPGKEATW